MHIYPKTVYVTSWSCQQSFRHHDVMFFMHNCCRIPALQLTTIASDGPSCRGSWTSSNKPAAAAVHCTSRAARCRKPVPRRPRRASRRSCAGRVWARSSCGVSWCLSSVRVGAASAGPRRRHRHCINKNMVAVMLKNDRAANAVENRDISVSWISAFQQTFCEVKGLKKWGLIFGPGPGLLPSTEWSLVARCTGTAESGDQRDLPSAFSLAITAVITHASLVGEKRGIDFRRFFSRLQFCLIYWEFLCALELHLCQMMWSLSENWGSNEPWRLAHSPKDKCEFREEF